MKGGGGGFVIAEMKVSRESVARYASIPISFTTGSRLRVQPVSGGIGGFAITRENLAKPISKDYDAFIDRPSSWMNDFDTKHWLMLLAFENVDIKLNRPVGGLVLVTDSPEIRLLDGRKDLALLWNVRVVPEWRGMGVGSVLMDKAKSLARARGCVQMKVETQNTNPDACAFYESQGFRLGGVNLHAYRGTPGLEGEAMMLFYAEL